MTMHKLFVSMACMAALATMAGEPFTTVYNFESDASGWGFEGGVFQRAKASTFGVQANSGDYVLGKATVTFNEMIFTPTVTLAAGEPCTLAFELMAPGGTPNVVRNVGFNVTAGPDQTSATHTVAVGSVANQAYADWTHFEFTFTPEADGDYCFALKPFNPNFGAMCGGAYLDDVTISGTHPSASGVVAPDFLALSDLEPNQENLTDCQELPYIENFTNPEHYDGTSYLPIGWQSTGTMTWRTASIKALPAADGDYYMIAYHSDMARDENAYTPFFNLEADKTYTLSFKEFMQGNDYNEEGTLTTPTLYVAVGTEQDVDFQALLLETSERTAAWTERVVEFTPTISGPYCFSFILRGAANSGIVCVDQMVITADGLVAKPEPEFAPAAIFDLMDGKLATLPGAPVKFYNTGRYATAYDWYCAGASPENSMDEHPSFVFPQSGSYTIYMSATNERGTVTISHEYDVKVVAENDFVVLHPHNPGADKLFDRGTVPYFSTDPEADYVTGFNHYYRSVAQRFDLGGTQSVSISQLSCWVTDRRFRGTVEGVLDDQTQQPLVIKFYGATEDGTIDTNKVFGQHTLPIGEALGGFGLGSIAAENRIISFPEPIKVNGTVYVAMEFSDGMVIDPEDDNLGRSYISTSVLRSASGVTGIYGKTDKWTPIDQLDPDMAGLNAYWHMWGTIGRDESSIQAVEIIPETGIVYDLQGRRAANPTRGIFITNGKKIKF